MLLVSDDLKLIDELRGIRLTKNERPRDVLCAIYTSFAEFVIHMQTSRRAMSTMYLEFLMSQSANLGSEVRAICHILEIRKNSRALRFRIYSTPVLAF